MSELYTTTIHKQPRVWMKHPDDMVNGVATAIMQTVIPIFFAEFANDPTVFVINAGARRGPTGKIFPTVETNALRDTLLPLINNETKLCFDNMYEGNLVPIVYKIHELIKGTPIKASQCNYFSAALNAEELYNNYCTRNNITDKINIYSCNSWEHGLITYSKGDVSVEYVSKEKQKTVLCFNRILRSHRIALLGLMYSRNLVKNSYYSFFADSTYTEEPAQLDGLLDIIRSNTTDEVFNDIVTNYTANIDRFPLKLNIEWRDNVNYIKPDDLVLFDESYLSLVTETFFFSQPIWVPEVDEDAIFFSEKIYKPILMKHPFILAGRPHSLKYLKKMGYRTFEPYINESYDTMENNGDRLVSIVEEVARLNKNTPEQWVEWQNNIKEIVEHNHNVITQRKKHQYAFRRPDYETQY